MEHEIVSHEEWLNARRRLLVEEKEFTRARDELGRLRRALPWERVDKEYSFIGAAGQVTLRQLFGESSQLLVYHFMFDPDWEAGCEHCSFWADNFDGTPVHLKARDVSFVAISRAPYSKIAAYRNRMGWSFDWLSSFGSEFNFDFFVSYTPQQIATRQAMWNYEVRDPGGAEHAGASAFVRDGDALFHTYSTYGRGIDMLNGAYHYLDLVTKGRDEAGHDDPQFWVRRHDEY